jgi:hypothetical protein
MQKSKKALSIFMAAILLLLTCPEAFSGKVRVEAAGDPNVINFMDIYIEGFSEYSSWVPSMGNIGDVKFDMPGMTLKNVRFVISTGQLEYDIVPDAPIVMKSSDFSWFSDNGRTRIFEIYTWLQAPGHGATNRTTSWWLEEFPGDRTSSTAIFDLKGPPKYDWYSMWDDGVPSEVEFTLAVSDNQYYGSLMNGWRNGARRSFTKPLVVNSAPTLTVTTPSEQQLINESGFSGMNIEGYVRDVDNNDLVVSAEIPNVFYKKVNISQTLYNKYFSIPIDVLGDSIPPGHHTIIVKVVDPYNYKDERTLNINVSYRLRNKSYILINTPVDVSTSYTDYEGDPKYQERYRYDHDPNYFDNSMGTIGDSGLWRNDKYYSFPLVGRYDSIYQARDNPRSDDRFDEYRLWSRDNLSSLVFLVHRKPIAIFSAKLMNGWLQIADSSYDLDHISAYNKGLMDWQWQYKKTASEIWIDGQPPAQLPSAEQYDIRLRVRDVDGQNGVGVWSDWCVRTVGSASNLPPVAVFTVDPNIVSYRKATTVFDKSFDPDNDPLDVYSWNVVKDGWQQVWSHWGGAAVPPNIAAYGVGTYQLTLQVHDNRGLWSEPYSQTVQVINHPPAAAFNMPSEVYRDTVISLENLTPDPDEDGDGLIYGWNARINNSGYYYASGNRNPSMTIRDLIARYGISQQQAISEGWEMRLTASDGTLSSNATRLFTVKNHIPTAGIQGLANVFQYDSKTYYGVDADEDSSDVSSLQYYWKVTDSDGSKKLYRTVNINVDFPEAGTYTLEHWVVDQIGAKSNIASLKVNVTRNLAPSMILTTPAGTVSNPTVLDAELQGDPLVSWNYGDPENDPQEKYRLEFYDTSGGLVKTVENSDAGGMLREYQVPNLTFERFKYFTVYGRAYSKLSWSEISNEKTFIIDNPPKPGFTLMTDTGVNAARDPIYRTDLLNIKGTATDTDIVNGDSISYKYYLKPSGGAEGLAGTKSDFIKQFITNGTFTLRQVVTDSLGLYRERSQTITVVNRIPKVNITYPTSTSSSSPTIVSTLTPIIKWDYQDEDGDPQQQYKVRIINLETGAVTVQSGEQVTSVSQWQVPVDALAENQKYAAEVEAYDGYNWSNVSPRKYFMVNLLSVKGGVQHTVEWNKNRQSYNLAKSGNAESPRGIHVFWAGEKFVLQADATGLPDTIEVTMSGGYRTELSPTDNNRTLWTGELYDAGFEKLPDGPVTFTFTARNAYNTKTDDVTVTIMGDWSEYYQSHRIK